MATSLSQIFFIIPSKIFPTIFEYKTTIIQNNFILALKLKNFSQKELKSFYYFIKNLSHLFCSTIQRNIRQQLLYTK